MHKVNPSPFFRKNEQLLSNFFHGIFGKGCYLCLRKKSEAYKRTSVEIRIHNKSAEKRRRSLALCLVLAIFAAETDRGMKSLRRCLPLLALLLLAGSITSCRDTSCRDALLRAEALMETDPHAARAVLDSIDPPPTPPVREGRLSPLRGSGKGVFALFALLRTQADYKCDIPLTSDSLPLIATEYYGTRRKTQHAALAQHYLGCTYSEMHRDLEAIEAQLRATTLFPDTTDKYFAHSLLHLGRLYSRHYMVDSAWVAFGRYRQTESCNSDSTNISYADYYLGTVAFYKDNDELTDSLFQSVLSNTKTNKSIRFKTYFQLAKLYYYRKHNVEKALEYLKLTDIYYGEENGALLTLRADILAQQQPAAAYELYKKAIRNSSDIYVQCISYEGLASVAPLLNKPDSTRFFIDQYKSLLDSIYTMNKQREITEIKDKHLVEIHDQRQKARNMRLRLLGVVLLSAFIISLLLIERKRKNERLRFEQELNAIERRYIQENAPDDEEDDEEDIEEDVETDNEPAVHTDLPVEEIPSATSWFSLQEKRLTLYRNQYLASKWPGYFISHQADVEKKELMSPADSEQFLQYLSELFVNMMVDLYRESGHLNRSDMEFCCMAMLGFDANQIAYCCRKPVKYSYNRRTRLAERLTAEWYQFIFGKPSRQA